MSWLRRLTNTLRSGRHSRDLERELSFHLAERVDDLRAAGASDEEELNIGPGPVTSADSVGSATAVGDSGRFDGAAGAPPARPRPPPGI